MSSGQVPARIVAAAAPGNTMTLPDRLCRAMVQALRVDGAAIAALTHTPLRWPLVASDELADTLETVQFTAGEGPCVQASATGSPVIVADLHAEAPHQWPAFAATAARRLREIGAVFAFALRLDDLTLGSVNLYSRIPRTLTPTDITEASDAVSVAAIALITAPGPPDNDPPPPPASSLDQWHSMHLAIGAIADQLDTAPAQALAYMRAHAFARDVLLSELATAVLAGQFHARDLHR